MFERLGRLALRRQKRTLALFILAIIVCGVLGGTAISRLSGGGYSVPHSDSAKVGDYLAKTFHLKDPAIVIELRSETALITDPAFRSDAVNYQNRIAQVAGVSRTVSYWDGALAPLASKDLHGAYLFIYTDAANPLDSKGLAKYIQAKFSAPFNGIKVYIAGLATFNQVLGAKISKDLALAEGISIPLTFLLLLFVFGGLVSSAMPLVVGVAAIIGSLASIFIITLFTDVSVFALNLITGMGLGLGIDYALLIVNRFREELHAGKSVDDSIVATLASAGKTVFYSGITVIITLTSLTFFPLMFLKSFGYAGITVVAMAILVALIPFPAILVLLGPKIDSLVVRKGAITPKADGRWAQTARLVMKRPVAVVVLTLIVLGTIASPIRNIVFSQADARVMPASSPLVIASEQANKDFPGQVSSPIYFVIPHADQKINEVAEYGARIATVPGIQSVLPGTTVKGTTIFSAIETMSPRSQAAETLIHNLRKVPAPIGTIIGGVAADYADTQSGIASTLPYALGWVAIGVLVLLFIFTGSIILPIKAIMLNVISLAAMMGALTWIFIEGHLTWLVGSFINIHSIDTSMAILISVVTFGLSMDYEVFLLSRIKEEHESGLGNEEAVATGLQRSARIITAAALLLAIVFATFITSGVTNIKTLGFGVAFAILLDASIVRGLLVPALMRLFGERNWWAPQWMKRFTINH